jgi:hypothetical protein
VLEGVRFRVKHALGLDPRVDAGSREEKRVKTRLQSFGPDSIRTENALNGCNAIAKVRHTGIKGLP